MKTFALIVILLLAQKSSAFIYVEARGTFGTNFIDPNYFNKKLQTEGVKEVYLLPILGGDVVVSSSDMPVGVGYRYQYAGIKVDAINKGNDYESEVQSSKSAAVVVLRAKNDPDAYGGLIGTWGVSHSNRVHIKGRNGMFDYDEGVSRSYSIGVEGGTRSHTGLSLGAEMGIQYFTVNDLKGPSGTASFDLDFKGFYVLVHVGFVIGPKMGGGSKKSK